MQDAFNLLDNVRGLLRRMHLALACTTRAMHACVSSSPHTRSKRLNACMPQVVEARDTQAPEASRRRQATRSKPRARRHDRPWVWAKPQQGSDRNRCPVLAGCARAEQGAVAIVAKRYARPMPPLGRPPWPGMAQQPNLQKSAQPCFVRSRAIPLVAAAAEYPDAVHRTEKAHMPHQDAPATQLQQREESSSTAASTPAAAFSPPPPPEPPWPSPRGGPRLQHGPHLQRRRQQGR